MISLECYGCGKELSWLRNKTTDSFKVSACFKCIEKAREEGYQEGHIDGEQLKKHLKKEGKG